MVSMRLGLTILLRRSRIVQKESKLSMRTRDMTLCGQDASPLFNHTKYFRNNQKP